jgi:hypothetical protein
MLPHLLRSQHFLNLGIYSKYGVFFLLVVLVAILVVVLLREEHRLGVFENRVLRRIFGRKRNEVTGEWRKLHNEELRYLYSSPSIIRIIKSRRMRWAM